MIVDSHQHFWNLDEVYYSWLVPAYGPIYRTFEPAELESLAEEAGLVSASSRPLVPEPGAQGPALVMLTGRRPVVPVRTIQAEAIEEKI